MDLQLRLSSWDPLLSELVWVLSLSKKVSSLDQSLEDQELKKEEAVAILATAEPIIIVRVTTITVTTHSLEQ